MKQDFGSLFQLLLNVGFKFQHYVTFQHPPAGKNRLVVLTAFLSIEP